MAKITYEDKVFLNKNSQIADKNKVNDSDLNEIKEVVNQNDENVGNLSDLNTNDKSSLVRAISSTLPVVLYETEKTYSSIPNDTIITLNGPITSYNRAVVYGISESGRIISTELYKPDINDSFSLSGYNNGNRSGYYAYTNFFRNFIIQSATQIKYDTGTQLGAHLVAQNNIQGHVSDIQSIKIYAILAYN